MAIREPEPSSVKSASVVRRARASSRQLARARGRTGRRARCASERPTRPRIWYSCDRPSMSARSIDRACWRSGCRGPLSMIVVATSTSKSRAQEARASPARAGARLIWPWPDADARARARSGAIFAAASSIVSTRLCRIEDLPVALELALDGHRARAPRRTRRRACGSGRRPCGGGLDHRDVAHARERHVQRARDRRGADSASTSTSSAQLAQQLLLRDAEALLLVDDHQARGPWACTSRRQQPVRADQDVDLALARSRSSGRLDRPWAAEARDHARPRPASRAKRSRNVCEVLLGEHRGRHEHHHLAARRDDLHRRAHRDLGLAEADVAADQAVHRAAGAPGRP